MIFGTHLALDNSDHVLDGGPNPPTEGFFLQNVPRHNGGFTKRTTSRSGRPSSAVAELLLMQTLCLLFVGVLVGTLNIRSLVGPL